MNFPFLLAFAIVALIVAEYIGAKYFFAPGFSCREDMTVPIFVTELLVTGAVFGVVIFFG